MQTVSYHFLYSRRYMGHIVRGANGYLIPWHVLRDKNGKVDVSVSTDGRNESYQIIDFYVTHFEREAPPEEGYVRLPYMTATKESLMRKIYFMGFGQHRPFDEEYLQSKIKSGSLIKLPAPHKITRDKGLWMDAEGAVFMADKNDPVAPRRQKIINI